jgi:hypothetical protein
MLHRKKKTKPVTPSEVDADWHKTYGIYYCKECGCNYSHGFCPTHGGAKTCEVLKEVADDD